MIGLHSQQIDRYRVHYIQSFRALKKEIHQHKLMHLLNQYRSIQPTTHYVPPLPTPFLFLSSFQRGISGLRWQGGVGDVVAVNFYSAVWQAIRLYLIVFARRMSLKLWLIWMLTVAMTSCYSLEGVWSLQSPANSSAVSLQISNFVFKNQQILQKLVFKSCQQMRLQASFSSNGVYINFKTQWVLPIANLTCDSSSSAVLKRVSSKLRKVFNFEIRNDSLIFQNPLNETVFIFKRMASDRKENIDGIWTLRKFGNTTTSLAVTIGKGQINLCQGNTIMNYSLGKDKIQLQPVLSNCASISLEQTLKKIKYYRRKSDILLFYNASVKPIMEMVYSQPYKTIIETANIAENETGEITVKNITGNWSILSLFGAKFPSTPYSLAFNSSHLSLLGGCKNYSLPYSLTSITQVISIGKTNLTSPKICQQSDDQFYISGLTKMMRYVIIKSDVSTSLRFYDDNGTAGYFLILTKKENAKLTINSTKTPLPVSNIKIVKKQVSNTTSSATPTLSKVTSQPENISKTASTTQNPSKIPLTLQTPAKSASSSTSVKAQPTNSSAAPLGKKL